MPPVRLIALTSVRYGAKRLQPGDAFNASPSDAKILLLLKRARREYQTAQMQPEPEPEPKPAPAPAPAPEVKLESVPAQTPEPVVLQYSINSDEMAPTWSGETTSEITSFSSVPEPTEMSESVEEAEEPEAPKRRRRTYRRRDMIAEE